MTIQEALMVVRTIPGFGGISDLTALAGDASFRTYYRGRVNDGDGAGPETTVVVMEADQMTADIFRRTTALFDTYGIDVPSIYGCEGGWIILEDLGDLLLQEYVRSMTADAVESEYEGIIDDLINFQLASIQDEAKIEPVYRQSFDIEKLTYEVEFATTHLIEGYLRGAPLPESWREAIRQAWAPVIAELAEGKEEVLCHRDFHARNILVAGDRRVWIDHQDARTGRMTYDLASLLWDPYVNLTTPVRARLAEYYFRTLSKWVSPPWDGLTFSRLLTLTAMQRIYKALGTFGYQSTMKDSTVYLEYIPIAAADMIDFLTGEPAVPADLADILLPLLKNGTVMPPTGPA